jgi:hypothetical protein
VILAPFGLSAVLTGNKNENFEQFSEKIISDWNNFYPMKKLENDSTSKMPQLVEVISGERRLESSPELPLNSNPPFRRNQNAVPIQVRPRDRRRLTKASRV